MKKFLLVILILTFLISAVNYSTALGVTPARNTLDFDANKQIPGSFKILNSENIKRELVVQTRGELAKNIILGDRRVDFNSGESEKQVTYSLQFPKTLSPGLHIGEIVISEPPKEISDEDTVVGATLSVVTQIYVYVTYPGKYAEAKLNVQSAGEGEDVQFSISVLSRGEFDLTKVYANIDVYSELNEKIDSFNTNSI